MFFGSTCLCVISERYECEYNMNLFSKWLMLGRWYAKGSFPIDGAAAACWGYRLKWELEACRSGDAYMVRSFIFSGTMDQIFSLALFFFFFFTNFFFQGSGRGRAAGVGARYEELLWCCTILGFWRSAVFVSFRRHRRVFYRYVPRCFFMLPPADPLVSIAVFS